MVYSTYKNGDDWGMVYYCFNHIIENHRKATGWGSQNSVQLRYGCGRILWFMVDTRTRIHGVSICNMFLSPELKAECDFAKSQMWNKWMVMLVGILPWLHPPNSRTI